MFRIGTLLIYRAITQRFGRLAIAFAGVALAIGCLVFLEGLMVGVGDAMVQNSVALHHGHLAIASTTEGLPLEELTAFAGVLEGILKRRQFEGVLEHDANVASVRCYGVDPQKERRHTVIAKKIVVGRYLDPISQEIVIGNGLARRLDVDVGQDVIFLQPGAASRTWRVAGIYRTGIELLDAQTGFVPLAAALAGKDTAAVFLKPGADAWKIAAEMRKKEIPATPWQESMGELVQLVDLNYVSMNIVLLLALLILAFGVSNTVFISVTERIRELGLLKALGFTPGAIQILVQVEVVVLVLSAGVLGLAAGSGVCLWGGWLGIDLTRWTSENPHFIASGMVYPRLTPRAVMLPGMVAGVCGVLAAILPARRAGRIQVSEALRRI